MKTRQPFECPFPLELADYLETYLRVHRPVLLSCGGRRAPASTKALWLSQYATAMGKAAITYWIRRHTKEAFGAAMGPHLFRDAAATAVAIYAPEHVLIIKAILGHASIRTAERHYNQARGLEASRRYHGTIEERRKRSRGRRRGINSPVRQEA
jgi:integrase/recombinase XerD